MRNNRLLTILFSLSLLTLTGCPQETGQSGDKGNGGDTSGDLDTPANGKDETPSQATPAADPDPPELVKSLEDSGAMITRDGNGLITGLSYYDGKASIPVADADLSDLHQLMQQLPRGLTLQEIALHLDVTTRSARRPPPPAKVI